MPPIRLFSGVPSSLDPAFANEHDGALILRFLADPLVDYTDDGRAMPAAATGWSLDPDGRRIVFTLRKGVRFHHGRAVVAEDYVYSLRRLADPAVDSPLSYHLSMVEGFDDFRSGRRAGLSGVRAIDGQTLEVRLRDPFHEAHHLFGHRATAAVPRELIESDPEGFAVRPVSTGPFRMARPAEEDLIQLEPFPGYYGANGAFADGGHGRGDALAFHVYDDVSVAVRHWREGRLDITKVPPPSIPDAQRLGGDFHATPSALIQYLGFPVTTAPFDNPLVRRAVAMCIDRKVIIETAFHGTRQVANRILPPMVDLDGADDLIAVPYDPAGARALLAAAGVRTDRVLCFRYNAGLGHDGWVQSLLAQINEGLGWAVEARPMEWQDYLLWLHRPDSMFRMTWAMDYPSPDNFLAPLFHSGGVGQDNATGFQDAEFDRLLGQARGTADARERRHRYRQAEEAACAAVPLFPLWFGVQYHLIARERLEIRGRPVDLFGEPTLRGYSRR